jgi:DNA polymerase elongation subunit (family B)
MIQWYNIIVGCFGFTQFRFSDLEVASRITKYGRKTLQWLIEQVKLHGTMKFEMIFGHTDSLMLYLEIENNEEVGLAINAFNSLYDLINSSDEFVKIKLECILRKVVLLGKNRYYGMTFRVTLIALRL